MPAERARRAIPLALAWVAAAVIAVAVASWGVALVGRSVTEDRPAALAAADVEERLAEVASSTTSTPPTVPPETETTTTTTPGPVTTTTTAPPPTTAPSPTAVAGETRTYTLVGGTASLRFAPSGVTVVFANPAQGFTVESEPDHGNGVKVEFESESHESRLDGWWDDGPQVRQEERPEDG